VVCRQRSLDAKRILFFPLSNVLGHLSRTLALAEEFDAQGHEVFVAKDPSYAELTSILPPTIGLLTTPELPASATRCFGPILHYEDDLASDRANLASANRIDASELRRWAERLARMVDRDAAIVEEVRPDAVITDYHFTVELLRRRRPRHVFHISHILGYPSFYRRMTGSLFFPLCSGHLLVPGVQDLEYGEGRPLDGPDRASLCGPFRWRGWQRLSSNTPEPPPVDVLLFFGSTGNGEQIVPWLLRTIPERYRISSIAPGLNEVEPRGRAHILQHGDLQRIVASADVVFCHGGHGTVMECISQQRPAVVFPHNIEQLEIGRRIEALGLGVLIKRPYTQLGTVELGALIERLGADDRVRLNLEKYSALLRREHGPKRAVATVLQRLTDG
jgi:UDP:flavonoid glycosyltransferase YjiC (YdhE family)